MDFLSKLDEEQQAVALQVAKKAKEMGIEPRLAVAIAYQESGLRMPEKPGGAGEIGIMQVRPTTAKMIGFDPKELEDPARNIEIGLTYLKQGLERYRDPVLAAAGYNAGYDHPYFSNPDKPLPDSTKGYLKSINSMGGFSVPAPSESAEGAEPTDGAPLAEETPDNRARVATDIIGAGVGATAGKALDVGRGVGSLGQSLRDIAAAMERGQGPQGTTPGEKWAKKVTGYVKPGVQDVVEAATDYRRAMPQGKVSGPMAKRWGIPAPGEPTAIMDRLIARGQATPPPPPGAMQRIGSAVGAIPSAITQSPVLSGALGGLGAAEMGMEAMQRMQNKDPIGAAIAGVGAAGGALAVAPFPPARAVGLGVSAASPLTLYLLDKMRQTPAADAQRMLTNVDPMGNPMP